MTVFETIAHAEPDAIFKTKMAYMADKTPGKINLGIGAYRTDEGVPYVLNIVRKVEQELVQDTSLNKEYLPISGLAGFIRAAEGLMLGEDCAALKEGRVAGIQSLSGTGALRVLFEFVRIHLPGRTLYISDPTWGNHHAVAEKAGLDVVKYRYWDASTRGLAFDGMMADLGSAPEGSIVLLHPAAHNPTGVDPTADQWRQIQQLCAERHLVPFFDSAYQGFASGNLAQDAAAVRMFVTAGMEVLVAQSFAKNMGLYNMRTGCAFIVTSSADRAKAVQSQLNLVVRPMYSNPPASGARIVERILTNPAYFKEWEAELNMMSGRITKMRTLLHDELMRLKTPSPSGDWKHITSQIGMFSFTGLTPEQVDLITSKHHVYMLRNGRISMAGITTKNVGHLAAAMHDVIKTTSKL